ncbi:myrosinase 1-like [Schistocerca gregaria]|uniref:myrosinase 1-like n=1 Tax=Schistocerca gregaria TaxID=7010 RepID=UPI00211E24B4|nr:myrosinase 1-like [Schistocerca gregaria]XP_049837167.1 myrosinase 1-like [Schistocerca gregaria]XP_049837168.1 myrosinase 1-like [Schistocerca gregaria]
MMLPAFFAALLAVSLAQTAVNQFPDGFLLGAATSAYQIEGAWNESGKGESIWDHMFHEQPIFTTDGATGDVACDSYHKYKEDVQMLRAINATAYRFSISWSRVLPKGDLSVINQPGIDYYNNLINELLANGIQPVVTMYHWDLPQALQYLGGWANEVMVDYFADYAKLLFDNYGDRVKWWITFNEPVIIVWGYAIPGMPPGLPATGVGDYLATRTLVKAHARVWHLYDEQYRATQNGSVGMTFSSSQYEPYTNSTEDIEATERQRQFKVGIFAHPIYSQEGDYPVVVRERVDNNSKAEGLPRSRLPKFTQEEIEYIRGSADFFGLNTYGSQYIAAGEFPIAPSRRHDSGVIEKDDEIPLDQSAAGFRKILNWVVAEYPGYPIFVSENGLGNDGSVGLNDTDRIEYFSAFLPALLQAVNLDNVPVVGYTCWSLMDNLEWQLGYSKKYGLYQVDFDSPDRTRTPKESAYFMSTIYGTKQVPEKFFR